MREFLQTAIPVVLTAVLAGQVAVTRTGRLRKDILANLDLLGRLPADCPNRAELEVKNGELVGVLARRQRRRYGPFTQAGFSLGVLAGLAGLAVAFAGFSTLLAAGSCPRRRPRTRRPPRTTGSAWRSSSSLRASAARLRPGRRAGSAESTRSRRSSRPRRALLPTEPACWSWPPMTSMELLARALMRAPARSAPVWDDFAALVE